MLDLLTVDTLVVRTLVTQADSLAASHWPSTIQIVGGHEGMRMARAQAEMGREGWIRWVPMLSPFLAVLLASLFSVWQTSIGRREQKQVRRESAFSLFLAITQEMRIILHRTWEMIDSAAKGEWSRASMNTDAKEACLAELIKLMPWEPALGLILHFYENVSLIAVHQNNAVRIPEAPPSIKARGGDALMADRQRREAEFNAALAFAIEKYPSMFMQYEAVWRALQKHASALGRELASELRPVTHEEFERRRRAMGALRAHATPAAGTAPASIIQPGTG